MKLAKASSRTNSEPPQRIVPIGIVRAEADALFLSIGEGAIAIDSSGYVSRINQVALKILGIKADDILGKWYPDFVVLEDDNGDVIARIERPLTEALISGKPVFRKVYLRRRDKARVAIALTVSPILSNGRPIGAIEIFRDISEEVKLDKAKNEFIALASHQLRTPATGVKQYIGMLLEGYAGELTDAQLKFLRSAHEGNERQLRIIDDILKVAAADSGTLVLHKQKVNIISLIKSAIEDHATSLTFSNHTITFTHEDNTAYARVDSDVFRMVVENIIDNARKYTYPGKGIHVTVTNTDKCVRLSVADEGVGIKKSDMEKLFKKFSRLDNPLSVSSGGTGLGLYWVKQVMDLHKGSVSVSSKLGKGTTFTLEIAK